jgi:hypothetical protein
VVNLITYWTPDSDGEIEQHRHRKESDECEENYVSDVKEWNLLASDANGKMQMVDPSLPGE